uniref:Uncharacterized protein n=1 Tax=Salix viminalis TaxID=40686 RepID=A0A6N2NJ48_SALVM
MFKKSMDCWCRVYCSVLDQTSARLCDSNDFEIVSTSCNWSYFGLLLPRRSGIQCCNLYIEGECCAISSYDNMFYYWSHYHDTSSSLSFLLASLFQLMLHTFQVVLMPTIVGVLSNEFFPKVTSKIVTVTPLIGVILTTLLCASPIGQVSDVLKAQGGQLIMPVALLHVAAFALGYWMSRMSFGESTSRTISIECGMQLRTWLFACPETFHEPPGGCTLSC